MKTQRPWRKYTLICLHSLDTQATVCTVNAAEIQTNGTKSDLCWLVRAIGLPTGTVYTDAQNIGQPASIKLSAKENLKTDKRRRQWYISSTSGTSGNLWHHKVSDDSVEWAGASGSWRVPPSGGFLHRVSKNVACL